MTLDETAITYERKPIEIHHILLLYLIRSILLSKYFIPRQVFPFLHSSVLHLPDTHRMNSTLSCTASQFLGRYWLILTRYVLNYSRLTYPRSPILPSPRRIWFQNPSRSPRPVHRRGIMGLPNNQGKI